MSHGAVARGPSLAATLATAERVVAALRAHDADAVVIGAMALAVHGYPRDTVDLDLAVAVELKALHEVAEALARKGLRTEVRDPDADDPLGGVLDVEAPRGALVQVVNFSNPPAGGFPRLVQSALASALPLVAGRPLRVVDVYHLVAFKLYAGGAKSALDIRELLDRNPGLDRRRLRGVCRRLGLAKELTRALRDGVDL